VNPVRRPAAMRNISEWMEHVIARADRRAAHQVGGDRVSDALSGRRWPVGIKPGRDYPLAPDGKGAVRPFAGGHGGTICPQLEIALSSRDLAMLLFISPFIGRRSNHAHDHGFSLLAPNSQTFPLTT
jgi:hypothetical protein